MTSEQTEEPRPIITMAGEQVALGPLRHDLIPTYLRWVNDFAVMRTFGDPRPYTREQTSDWGGVAYEHRLTSSTDHWFTIYEALSLRPIGHTDLFHIDDRNRTAEFGIVIGETDAWGKGYGTETARLMLDYAFTALGLHSVMLQTDSFNLAGQRAYTKAGFREFGRRRECQWMGGRLWDVVYMEALASEFESPMLAQIFRADEPR